MNEINIKLDKGQLDFASEIINLIIRLIKCEIPVELSFLSLDQNLSEKTEEVFKALAKNESIKKTIPIEQIKSKRNFVELFGILAMNKSDYKIFSEGYKYFKNGRNKMAHSLSFNRAVENAKEEFKKAAIKFKQLSVFSSLRSSIDKVISSSPPMSLNEHELDYAMDILVSYFCIYVHLEAIKVWINTFD